MNTPRPPLRITLSVWQALLLRESLTRLFSRRAAWVWLLVEPAVHMAFLVFIFTVIRVRHVGGIETGSWILVGMLAFFFFRRTGTQASNAISANRPLFAYRQVKPVDSVLVRGILEGALTSLVTALIFFGAYLFNIPVVPGNPLLVMQAVFGLWLLGLSFGLITSVLKELIPELGNIIGLMMLPMYLISGVIMPLSAVPYTYRQWLMLNPVAHGVEAARLGFAPYYHAVPELNVGYLYGSAFALVFIGLALHARFAQKLITQ